MMFFGKTKLRTTLNTVLSASRPLAEEIIVGWVDQTDLDGDDHTLTAHALEYFGEAIQDGLAEAHHDEFARNTIALCCRNLSGEMQDGEDSKLDMTRRSSQLAR